MKRKQAFTLMELLIVVIVLGILAGVAVPKMLRVLETRKTGEAEEVLSAVRTEQEKRCIMGKNYLGESKRDQLVALKGVRSAHYIYNLNDDGSIEAQKAGTSGAYTLKMWYKTGELCCSGNGCAGLNKDYPLCPENIEEAEDECIVKEEKGCNDCSCPAFAQANPGLCFTKPACNGCECADFKKNYPDQCSCYNAEYAMVHPSECSCANAQYKKEHPSECSCANAQYAAANPDECKEKHPCEDYAYASANVEECCDSEYAALYASLCTAPAKGCEDDEHFASHTQECCEQGSNRDECFEYAWDSSVQKQGLRYAVKWDILGRKGCGYDDQGKQIGTCRGKDWDWALAGYCTSNSGDFTMKDPGWVDANGRGNGNITGTRCLSVTYPVACNKQQVGKSFSFYCQAFYEELGAKYKVGNKEHRDINLYDATITYTCTKQRKTFSSNSQAQGKAEQLCNK